MEKNVCLESRTLSHNCVHGNVGDERINIQPLFDAFAHERNLGRSTDKDDLLWAPESRILCMSNFESFQNWRLKAIHQGANGALKSRAGQSIAQVAS